MSKASLNISRRQCEAATPRLPSCARRPFLSSRSVSAPSSIPSADPQISSRVSEYPILIMRMSALLLQPYSAHSASETIAEKSGPTNPAFQVASRAPDLIGETRKRLPTPDSPSRALTDEANAEASSSARFRAVPKACLRSSPPRQYWGQDTLLNSFPMRLSTSLS